MKGNNTYHAYNAILLSAGFLDYHVPRRRRMVEMNLDLGGRLLLWRDHISPPIFRRFYVSESIEVTVLL